MPTLVFVRHAETEFNREQKFTGRIDCNITQEGFEQAKKILSDDDKNFDYIYCSPLKRTSQTLEAIIPGSKPIIDERIIEVSIGDWEGKKVDTLDEKLLELYGKGRYTPPNSETVSEIDKRVCDFVESLFDLYHCNEKILIVTHGGILISIKRNFLKDNDSMLLKNLGSIVLTESDYEYYLQKNINK